MAILMNDEHDDEQNALDSAKKALDSAQNALKCDGGVCEIQKVLIFIRFSTKECGASIDELLEELKSKYYFSNSFTPN